jgi:hypothetical protein
MAPDNHVTDISLFAVRQPAPEVAAFQLAPRPVKVLVATRTNRQPLQIQLRESCLSA